MSIKNKAKGGVVPQSEMTVNTNTKLCSLPYRNEKGVICNKEKCAWWAIDINMCYLDYCRKMGPFDGVIIKEEEEIPKDAKNQI